MSLKSSQLCSLRLNTACANIFAYIAMNNRNIKVSIKKPPKQMAFLLSRRQSIKCCFKALIETMGKAGEKTRDKMP